MFVSINNPWIYMFISLIMALIIVPLIFKKSIKKTKQLSINDLYPESEDEY